MSGSDWGGSEELWYQVALWMARHNYAISVCCFDGAGKIEKMEALRQAGCLLTLLPGKEETKKQLLLGKIKLSKAVAEIPFEEYDKAIISQGGWKDVTHGPFKKLYKRMKDYILIYHNYNIHEKFSLQKFSLLQKWADKATKNLGAAIKIFDALEEAYSLKISNKERLFNPLTIETPQTPAAFVPPVDGKYIFSVFAALDVERKAQDVLIKALANPAWQKRNWELHLFGEGKDKESLKALVKKFELTEKIFVWGNAENYTQAIQNSHLVLQITHIDAMPITVMESLAMARPVVISNVGDMPLWIQEGKNGWITESVSTEDINRVLELAWNQRNRWEEMGKESFAIFKDKFPADPISYFINQTGLS